MFDYDSEWHYTAKNSVSGPCTPEEVKWSHRHAMSWKTLSSTSDIFPQHTEQALHEIKKHLGYMPHSLVSLRHETFIRALVEEYRQNRLSEEDFNAAIAAQVKHIRNDDMQRNGWASAYTDADYERYNSYLLQYKNLARQRLTERLQFEPDLQYSLDAEIILRDLFTVEGFQAQRDIYTAFDAKACTIVFYRMALAEADRDVANALDLMGIF